MCPAHLAEEFHLFAADHIDQGHGGLAQFFEHRLLHHMEEISSILFFLMGAMTIVELIDAHEGFRVITDRIQTRNKVKMLWIVCVLTFFFSALLDNLTTSIVMVSLLAQTHRRQANAMAFCGHGGHCGQCGRSVVAHRRCHHHHALDRGAADHDHHRREFDFAQHRMPSCAAWFAELQAQRRH